MADGTKILFASRSARMIGVKLRPWTLVERIVCWLVLDGNRTVATLEKPYGEENRAAAEARMLSAAPELCSSLEELRSFVAVMCGRGPDAILPESVSTPLGVPIKIGEIMRAADAAIAKARGKS